MSYLLLDQSLMLTAFLLADVTLLITFLFGLEDERLSFGNWRTALRRSLVLATKALPLMALIFILFPRFSTGFGTGTGSRGKMGVTDSLKPGSVESLIESDELIFRASFLDGSLPPRQGLYWRGAILDQSHGLEWDRTRLDRVLPTTSQVLTPDIEVYLEPGNERYLFSLDTTVGLSLPNDLNHSRVVRRSGGVFELDRALQTRERYVIADGLERPQESEDPTRFLQTEDELTPRTSALLKKIRRPQARATVRELLLHFRTAHFSYSLSPPKSDSIDQFFFERKIGFCEHFAGATATLLRHMGIPARVVVGFQGGTPSLLDNFMSVRARDAHAWVEYYDSDDHLWRRIDPTAEVEPQRISMGSDSYGMQAVSWLPTGWNRAYFRSRALLDEIDARWIGFLIRFDLARQQELLAHFGMEGVLFRALPVFLFLAVVLVLAFLYFFEAQRREPLNDIDKLNVLLLQALRRWRIDRLPSEGPTQFFARIQKLQPQLSAHVEPLMAEIAEIRFGTRRLSPSERADLRRRLLHLKKL
jgi:transglutaminase-like putative cysteine protease